jgi:hypothetical protein
MKKIMRACFLVLCLIVIPFSAWATTVNFTFYSLADNSYGLNAGQFSVGIDFDLNNVFEYPTISFCVDESHSITIPGTYKADLLSLPASSPTSANDWVRAAWLMDTYAPGFHGGAGYSTYTANETMAGLQMAIWHYTGQSVPVKTGHIQDIYEDFTNSADGQFKSTPVSFSSSNYRLADLYTLGVTGGRIADNQDQLIRIPTIPEPGTLMLLGLGLLGLGLARSKNKI